VYLLVKVTLPTLPAKQLVLVPLRWSFQMINLILLIPKQLVLVSRRVVLLTAKILYFCAQMQVT